MNWSNNIKSNVNALKCFTKKTNQILEALKIIQNKFYNKVQINNE